MTINQKIILANIEQYLIQNPGMRFGQALVNLNIITRDHTLSNLRSSFVPKDPFNDSDTEIIERLKMHLK